MSVLSIGLSETVREWFSSVAGGGGGTAVQTAPPIETATKPKKTRTAARKKIESAEEDTGGAGTATAEAPTDVSTDREPTTLETGPTAAVATEIVAPPERPDVSPWGGAPGVL